MIVEDNQDDELLIRRSLKSNGLINELIVANDGQVAIDCLFPADGTEPGLMPGLILLDLRLPRVNGHEVLKRVRSEERTRRIPVVILTSTDEQEEVVVSYNLGANSFVRKPVKFEDFVSVVSDVGLYWVVTNVESPDSE
jgi:two-component system response regulator